jgi:sugar/nucleoside kinase (ribokinase family)
MRQIDVLTSGYVSMDHIIKIASPAKIGYTSLVTNRNNVDIFYGGCSVNIAYGLSRLGLRALPVLRVGGDYIENGFKAFLEEGGVSTEGIQVIEEEATSVCYLLQDNNNDHITIFYPGAMDEKYARPLEEELFQNTKLGVITVASRGDNEEFYRQCVRHQVPVVFGMKDDFDAFPEEFLKVLLTGSKIIFTNEVEREIIEKMYGFQDITELFAIGSPEIIVTTLGKEGSICYQRTPEGIVKHQIGICRAETVVDATGSGDAYMAGFLYGYLKGMEPAQCCRLGSVLSWFVLQAEGCCTNMPGEEALLEKYNQLMEEAGSEEKQ